MNKFAGEGITGEKNFSDMILEQPMVNLPDITKVSQGVGVNVNLVNETNKKWVASLMAGLIPIFCAAVIGLLFAGYAIWRMIKKPAKYTTAEQGRTVNNALKPSDNLNDENKNVLETKLNELAEKQANFKTKIESFGNIVNIEKEFVLLSNFGIDKECLNSVNIHEFDNLLTLLNERFSEGKNKIDAFDKTYQSDITPSLNAMKIELQNRAKEIEQSIQSTEELEIFDKRKEELMQKNVEIVERIDEWTKFGQSFTAEHGACLESNYVQAIQTLMFWVSSTVNSQLDVNAAEQKFSELNENISKFIKDGGELILTLNSSLEEIATCANDIESHEVVFTREETLKNLENAAQNNLVKLAEKINAAENSIKSQRKLFEIFVQYQNLLDDYYKKFESCFILENKSLHSIGEQSLNSQIRYFENIKNTVDRKVNELKKNSTALETNLKQLYSQLQGELKQKVDNARRDMAEAKARTKEENKEIKEENKIDKAREQLEDIELKSGENDKVKKSFEDLTTKFDEFDNKRQEIAKKIENLDQIAILTNNIAGLTKFNFPVGLGKFELNEFDNYINDLSSQIQNVNIDEINKIHETYKNNEVPKLMAIQLELQQYMEEFEQFFKESESACISNEERDSISKRKSELSLVNAALKEKITKLINFDALSMAKKQLNGNCIKRLENLMILVGETAVRNCNYDENIETFGTHSTIIDNCEEEIEALDTDIENLLKQMKKCMNGTKTVEDALQMYEVYGEKLKDLKLSVESKLEKYNEMAMKIGNSVEDQKGLCKQFEKYKNFINGYYEKIKSNFTTHGLFQVVDEKSFTVKVGNAVDLALVDVNCEKINEYDKRNAVIKSSYEKFQNTLAENIGVIEKVANQKFTVVKLKMFENYGPFTLKNFAAKFCDENPVKEKSAEENSVEEELAEESQVKEKSNKFGRAKEYYAREVQKLSPVILATPPSTAPSTPPRNKGKS